MQGCSTFYWYGPHLREKSLLRATCIFTKIKLQIIASLLYKIGGSLWPVFRVSVPKPRWRPKKKKKKVFAANPNWFRENQTEEGFGLDLFISQKMLSKPFHEKINRAKRPCRPHKTDSRAKCGPRAMGWAALVQWLWKQLFACHLLS